MKSEKMKQICREESTPSMKVKTCPKLTTLGSEAL